MDTRTFKSRLAIAEVAVQKVQGYLLWNGIPVYHVSQESWLPKWVHNRIKMINGQGLELLRHFPDMATDRALLQIKSAKDAEKYPSVTIEQASFDVSLTLSKLGIPVLLVWWTEHEMLAGWAGEVGVSTPATDRLAASGSHSPFYLVKKTDLKTLTDFKEKL
jgi:hypothetical protein